MAAGIQKEQRQGGRKEGRKGGEEGREADWLVNK